MKRTAVRLTIALACLAVGWLSGSQRLVRAQEESPRPAAVAEPISAIAAGAAGTLYVVRGGEPYECRVGRVPGSSVGETASGFVCEPLALSFR